jgi:FdhD protein
VSEARPQDGASVSSRGIVAVRHAGPGPVIQERADTVTVEEPLEIRLGDTPVAVVMRTPGEDFELVSGFLLTEGILTDPADLGALTYCPSATPPNEHNVVDVRLAAGAEVDVDDLRRNLYVSSSCGVCGKTSIDQVRAQSHRQPSTFAVGEGILLTLPDSLRKAQKQFEHTGSVHAAGLFDAEGRLLALREDVGRHNAVDKLIGRFVLDGRWPPASSVLMLSGRTSFEIVQKALLAGLGFIASVSGPSSLAVDLADESGLTLVGFLRDGGYNLYTHGGRLRRQDAPLTQP